LDAIARANMRASRKRRLTDRTRRDQDRSDCSRRSIRDSSVTPAVSDSGAFVRRERFRSGLGERPAAASQVLSGVDFGEGRTGIRARFGSAAIPVQMLLASRSSMVKSVVNTMTEPAYSRVAGRRTACCLLALRCRRRCAVGRPVLPGARTIVLLQDVNPSGGAGCQGHRVFDRFVPASRPGRPHQLRNWPDLKKLKWHWPGLANATTCRRIERPTRRRGRTHTSRNRMRHRRSDESRGSCGASVIPRRCEFRRDAPAGGNRTRRPPGPTANPGRGIRSSTNPCGSEWFVRRHSGRFVLSNPAQGSELRRSSSYSSEY
jgi:hypothetical protein